MNFILVLIIFLSSCGLKNVNFRPQNYVIERANIVVLPFENISNDITAEEMIRDLVIAKFRKKGWSVIDKNHTDQKLKEIGITDGGQLNSITKKELFNIFNTRYICYGTINEFKFQNLGFIILKKVELNIKIYDTSKDDYVFDETSDSSDLKVYLDREEAKKAFITYNALKLVENIMKRPLYNQAVEAVDKIFAKF